MLPIYDISPFSLLDFPDRLSCIFWFAGCNMRCSYCYNSHIITGKGSISEEEALEFLEKRKGLLDGVVLSGGECTLYPKIAELCEKICSMGFEVKLDTNGSRPEVVEYLLAQQVISYVALDYKAPKEKFAEITQSKLQFEKFTETLELLCAQNEVKFEVRTTVHQNLLSQSDLAKIQKHLQSVGYKNPHYIQNFINSERVLEDLPDSSPTTYRTDEFSSEIETIVR